MKGALSPHMGSTSPRSIFSSLNRQRGKSVISGCDPPPTTGFAYLERPNFGRSEYVWVDGVGPCLGRDISGLRSHNLTPDKSHLATRHPHHVGPRGATLKAPSHYWHVGFHPVPVVEAKNSLLGSCGSKRGNFRHWGGGAGMSTS